MIDDLTLTSLGGAALTEGVKFLYAQAGEALKHRRERAVTETPEIVARPRHLPAPEPEALQRLEPELRALRAALADYATGSSPVDADDPTPVRIAEALRRVLEVVYRGVRLEFAGESRPDIAIHGRIKVRDVEGYVAAVLADHVTGTVEGEVEVRNVKRDGEAVGVDVRSNVGDRNRR